MAELATVARPYAEAAFSLAREAGEMSKWANTLRGLSQIAQDGNIEAALDSPKLTADQKTSLFTDVLGANLDEIGKRFVGTVVAAGRAKLLPHISAQFDALKNDAENTAVATIRTAMPLTTEQKSAFAESLKKKFGKAIEIKETIDESLIAGAIITVGDRVIDGSAKGRLAAMSVGVRA